MVNLKSQTHEENAADILLMQKDIEYIKLQLTEISHQLSNEYITRAEFAPVQKIVYGGVSVALIAVLTALLALVINK